MSYVPNYKPGTLLCQGEANLLSVSTALYDINKVYKCQGKYDLSGSWQHKQWSN